MTIPNISAHEAIRNIQTEEYNVQDGQIKLTEMLVKLVEKLDQLEQELNGKKILQQHLKQRRKGKAQEVICHASKQPGYFSRKCAVTRIQLATMEILPPPK